MKFFVSNFNLFSFNIFYVLLICFNSTFYSQQLSLKQLTFSDSTHDGYPYWSPDGEYIIYSSGTYKYCSTMIIPVTGVTPIKWVDYFAQHAQYSPDGKY